MEGADVNAIEYAGRRSERMWEIRSSSTASEEGGICEVSGEDGFCAIEP